MKTILFALLVLTVAITGCKKDSETANNESTNTGIQLKSINTGIQLKNGYLVFEDSVIFNEHLIWIMQNEANPEIIDQFNKMLGFESFSEVYDKGMRMTDPAEFDEYRTKNPDCFRKVILEDNSAFWEMPMASMLSYFVDKQGVYQIGEIIIRNTEDIDFSTINPQEFSIIIETPLALLDEEIIKKYKESLIATKTSHYSYRTAYFKWSDRRIVARLYASSSTYPTKHKYESRTTSKQRHWSGVWVKAKIDEVGQTSQTGVYYVKTSNGNQGPYYINVAPFF